MKDDNGVVWRGALDSDGNPDYYSHTAISAIEANRQSGSHLSTDVSAGQYINTGAEGNLCHVDCSNRGLCNHETGQCRCYRGYYGAACENMDVRAKGDVVYG